MNVSALFVPLMAYVQGLDRQESPQPQVIYDELQRLIKQARDVALSHEIDLQRFHDALFPVVAWTDERLSMLARWQETRPWRAFMLQRKLFATSLAGVQFFERLGQLEPTDKELREVYLTCLALGFVGRYSQNPNSPELTELRQEQYRLLRAGLSETHLFPEAYRLVNVGATRRQWRLVSRAFWLLVILLPVIAIGALAYWFDYRLSEQVSEITRRLP